MKRRIILILFAALLLCACASKTEPEAVEPPKITAPAETELSLRLPLGLRDSVAKAIPAFTDGFAAAEGTAPLTFAVESADASVAEGVLEADGTLYVIAHAAGETKLLVTATADGAQAAATVTVSVRDARRTLVLVLAGVLAVALLILLGRPVRKSSAAESPAAAEEPDPVVIIVPEENTNEQAERS